MAYGDDLTPRSTLLITGTIALVCFATAALLSFLGPGLLGTTVLVGVFGVLGVAILAGGIAGAVYLVVFEE
ncbi:hypothetical protein AUR64_11345 [Haloprofundus marisrubri]|uniref:Uncharacterized protein n=1 Tax=Haloprofundus marisrubri TaxID=1514971 RepID=A0A0W1RAM9_9EURY|nr:hypothetical protein [Haloprofundus marisrubri]KTG10175.1 hypothetical protein AUR64_11345 [Haloprofundus marisrubri]